MERRFRADSTATNSIISETCQSQVLNSPAAIEATPRFADSSSTPAILPIPEKFGTLLGYSFLS
jgi:hypothetical protein